MATKVKEILDFMLARVPKEFKTELAEDVDLAEQGAIEMGIALGKDFTLSGTGIDRQVDEDLTMSEKWLASRFTYMCYLERLWDELNRNAVNFSTLTFAIKNLEKRPESVQDEIYKVKRYIENEVARASGSSCLVGYVTKFGG